MVFRFPYAFSFYELFSLHFSLCVTDLDVIGSGLGDFFVLLHTFVPILEVTASLLAKVVSNNAVNWRLWPIRTTESKLLFR